MLLTNEMMPSDDQKDKDKKMKKRGDIDNQQNQTFLDHESNWEILKTKE